MNFKDIVVYLDASEECEPRVRTAIRIAREHQARLVGVDISTKAAFDGITRADALAIEERFTEQMSETGLEHVFHASDPDAKTAHAFHSHSADLLISGQQHPDRMHLTNPAIPSKILVDAGVPMLVLPLGWAGEEPVGQSVVISYDFRRESTRAMHDAMPILTKASQVYIFIYSPNYSDENADVVELKEHLARHGINAKLDGWRDTGETDAASALFAGLDKERADLIVCGAYDHSPKFEDMFGGATKTLLNNISTPVFISH